MLAKTATAPTIHPPTPAIEEAPPVAEGETEAAAAVTVTVDEAPPSSGAELDGVDSGAEVASEATVMVVVPAAKTLPEDELTKMPESEKGEGVD